MQWEYLTAPDFAAAVQETGVCLLALGVLERHSEHLPLGTDFLNSHEIATRAAEQVPAVVFPPFYFGQIFEARCHPGTIALPPDLLLGVLRGVVDEIGRNGFRKIILVNGHGGNTHLLNFLIQCSLAEQKPYTLYLFNGTQNPEYGQLWRETVETEEHGHACECETSISLANHPEHVHMGRVVDNGQALDRLKHLPDGRSGIWWYADFPEHYAGNARSASAEKGVILRDKEVELLARYIRAVKEDTVTPALEQEFFAREKKLRG